VADPMFNERWHAETMTGMCGDTQSSSIRGDVGGAVRADASARGC
jgi:hypothetical protein